MLERSAVADHGGLRVPEPLSHVPPVADLAPVDLELDAVEHPSQVGGVSRFALRRVAVLRHAVAPDMSCGRQGRRRRTTLATLGHPCSLPGEALRSTLGA
jgi:hypothetical protein